MASHTPLIVSAVVCTFNRAPYLQKALESLAVQTLDRAKYEVLVVDNRSTDETKAVVDAARATAPNVRYIYEPTQGLSQARNTGWRESCGAYVAYLDDDAVASPRWLEQIVEVFESVTPRPGAVGGKIEPIWEAPRPLWLSDKVALGLTILDWSKVPFVLDESRWLAGANIAYPRELLEVTRGFDVTLGRKGNNLISCEETLLNHQLVVHGHPLYYDPRVSVHHHIAASRLAKEWHIRRQYWNGASVAIAERRMSPHSFGRRLSRAWTVMNGDLRTHRRWLAESGDTMQEAQRFEVECTIQYYRGYVSGMMGLVG
jgi:glycosyltransferase involved in cell wall biosynthesis